VQAPNALSTVFAQTPFGTGRQHHTNASEPFFPRRPTQTKSAEFLPYLIKQREEKHNKMSTSIETQG
jgi:hypothetical protein